DGESLASGGDDRQIVVWQVAAGKQAMRLPTHASVVYSVAYSPDSGLLAAVGFEHQVRIYDAHTGLQVKELEGPGRDLRSAVFSPDGKQLAVAGRNGQVRIWSVPSGKMHVEIGAGPNRIRTLAYLPEGDKLVSAGEGREIFIWDAHTGEEVYKFICPTGKVLSMAVCGENLIATGSSDNMVRIWNWRTQVQQEQLRGHTGSVASLAYDAASGVIISGSYDTTVRVWKLNIASPPDDTASPNKLESRVR
ncbi:MAG: WD40 repeat domain-containing protein, partial [Planctomycetia bacterium]|nr:WD40 repeat domain-containing protein [Planctomycetia bacterium]